METRILPPWIQEIQDKHTAGTAHLFILHFNVSDLIPWSSEYLIPRDFFARWLYNYPLLIFYNRSVGLSFATPTGKHLFHTLTGYPEEPKEGTLEFVQASQRRKALAALGEALPPQEELPTHPAKVFPLLEEAMKSPCLGAGQRAAIIVEFAESIVPSADMATMNEEDRTLLVTLLRWAQDPQIAERGHLLILTTGNLTDLHTHLRQGGVGIASPEVPLPDYEQRLLFAQYLLLNNGLTLEMSPAQFAQATAGLSRLQIRNLCLLAKNRQIPLTFEEIKIKKRQLLRQELAGTVEIIEPAHGLDTIGGLEAVKSYLQGVIRAVREGEYKLVPRGIILMGPPGVGKTAIAEALAKECGFNFVKITNPRDKWVGQSEQNFFKILQALRSLTPLVVLEDEADQSEQSRDEFSGDSGVSNRLRQMRFDFTGDPSIQGQVLWVRISNRPDKLDAADRRSGRGSTRIPLLMPDEEELKAILAIMPPKHGFKTALQDFTPVVEACQKIHPYLLSGADLEEISLQAYRRARSQGREVVEEADYLWATGDFIPSLSPAEIRRQEMLALRLCSSRLFVPPRYQAFLKAQSQASLEPEAAKD